MRRALLDGHCWLDELSLWVEELGCGRELEREELPPPPALRSRLPTCEGPGTAPTVSAL